MKRPPEVLNLVFFIAFCIAFVSILLFAFYGNIASTYDDSESNSIVMKTGDIVDDNVVELEGTVDFYWEQFLAPADINNGSVAKTGYSVRLPGTWNKMILDGTKIGGRGYATYRAQVYIDSSLEMAIKIKDYCNSYRLWVNGELVSQKGVPGKNKEETIPAKINLIGEFVSKKGVNEIVIQTANYREKYGGFREPFLLGSQKQINELSIKRKVIDAFILGIILIMAIYQIGLFVLNQDRKAFLYFGLFALFVFIRQALLSDIQVMDSFIQSNVPLYLKVAIASAVLSSWMVGLLFRNIFPELLSKIIIRGFSIYIGLVLVFIIVAPIYFVSAGMHFIQAIIVLFLFYILFLGIKVFYLKLMDRYIFAFGFFIVLLTTAVEFMIFNRIIYSGYTLHYGLIVFILFQAYALSAEFSLTNRENVQLTEELKEYNANLEKLVHEKTQDAIQAKDRELFSTILQKAETDNLLTEIYNCLRKADEKPNKRGEVFNDLILKVKNSMNQNETEKQLMHFEKVHPNFFNALHTTHPSLSQNELKLSAYMKLNMTHKDIGRILNIQPESVRKAKTRMRQKMGLTSDRDVNDYLRNFKL